MKKHIYNVPQIDIVVLNCHILSGDEMPVHYSTENEGEIEANQSFWEEDRQQTEIPSKSSLWDE